ncbi:MAG: adenylate/guanylate cyclase domain-containing protein [Candidatus Sericytochromatia bacterium]|nr:adenylate/guanylate cyclase domain-containing protein [Candidatus Sericytochromatia bacterium]
MTESLPLWSQGRRRWMTVMFADLVDFSGLARQLEPEALLELLDAVLGAIVPPVEAAGGRVDRFLGDGLLACFGDPVGHEDDAARAVQAAVAMQAALAALPAHPHVARAVAMRVGLATGHVVSGPVRAGGEGTWTVLGATVNLAKRLETHAAPGSILACDVTRRMARRRFAFLPLEPAVLKGFPEPVACHRVLGVRPESAGWGHRGPFVGRTELLDRFTALLDGRGYPRAILLHGPAGIGKTALLARLHSLARRSPGVRIIRAGMAAHRAEEPGAYLGRLWPLLAPGSPCPAPGAKDGEARVAGAAGMDPVVWLLDDVQWMDAWTQRVLAAALVRRAGQDLVVLAGRDPKGLAGFEAERVELAGLSDAEALHLLRLWTGVEVARVTPDELQAFRSVVRRASGNPLHLRELLQAGGGESPPGLHGLMQARLDHLPGAVREVALLAAVLGPRWPRPLWDALLRPEEQGAAARLAAHGIIRPCGDDEWGFADALLQEALYGQMLEPERRQRHARVAACSAMALLPPSWRARQWAAAGYSEEARVAWLDAAREALDAGGPREALVFFERSGPPQDARDWALWLRVRLAAGEAPSVVSEWPRILPLLEADPPDMELLLAVLRVMDALGEYGLGIALLERIQDRLAPGAQADRVAAERAWFAMRLGRWREARQRTRSVLHRVRMQPAGPARDALLARLQHDLAVHERLVGHVGSARRHAMKALVLRQALGDRLGEGDAWHNLGTILHARGDLRAAARALDRCRRLYLQESATRRWLAMELNMGVVRLELGEWDTIRPLVADWERRAVLAGDPLTAVCLALLQVRAALTEPRVEEAEPALERAAVLLRKMAVGAPWSDYMRLRAIALAFDGDMAGAGTTLDESLRLALAAGDRRQEALARRARARWAWHHGDHALAAREATVATIWHGRLGAFLEQARSLRLWQEIDPDAMRLSPVDGTMVGDPLERLRRAGAVVEARRLATREGVRAWQP